MLNTLTYKHSYMSVKSKLIEFANSAQNIITGRSHKHYFKWGLTKIHSRNIFFGLVVTLAGRQTYFHSNEKKTDYRLHIFLHDLEKRRIKICFFYLLPINER